MFYNILTYCAQEKCVMFSEVIQPYRFYTNY